MCLFKGKNDIATQCSLSKRVPYQGSRSGMVAVDLTVDIVQQKPPLFDGDVELQDLVVASYIEFALYKNKGLGAMCEPSSFHLVRRQCVIEEVVKVECSLVI